MKKKIYDILPPTSDLKEKDELTPKKEPPILEPKKEAMPVFHLNKLWILFFFFIILGFGLSFKMSSAEIEIWPKTDTKILTAKLILNKDIAAEFFEVEETMTEEFSSSGKGFREEKAEGIIRVFNNYSAAQILVVPTRFQAPLEKFQPALEKEENPWFRLLTRVVIPSKSYQDVKVRADSPGEKYNISASVFSLPGLAGSARYTFVYGQSFDMMSGGEKKEVSQVAKQDLEQAKDKLSEKIKEKCLTSLKNKIPADFFFSEEITETKIKETFTAAYVGQGLEKFNYQVKAEAKTWSFNQEEAKNWVKNYALSQISDQECFVPNGLKINYSLETVNLETGKVVLCLDIESKIYSEIDEETIKNALSGKSIAEAKIFLENQTEIVQAKVISPFWLIKIPEDMDKIKIKLNL